MRRIAGLLLLVFVSPLAAQTSEQKKATVNWLRDLQCPDGGFLPAPMDERLELTPRGGLRFTSSALRALKYFGGEAKDKAAAAKFVRSCWDADTGGFMDAPGGKVDVITTAIGLMAVHETGLPMNDFKPALNYLTQHAREFEEIRLAAAGLETWKLATKSTPEYPKKWLDDLISSRRDDHGFGAGAQCPRETGGRVVTMLRLGFEEKHAKEVVAILDAGQRPDGGFAKDAAGTSELETTYRIVRCYHMLQAKPAQAEAMKSFIAKCRNSDGGYGVAPGKPSTGSGTYFAGIILHWLEAKE